MGCTAAEAANTDCLTAHYGFCMLYGNTTRSIEAIHVDEEYLDANGNILWDKMDLM